MKNDPEQYASKDYIDKCIAEVKLYSKEESVKIKSSTVKTIVTWISLLFTVATFGLIAWYGDYIDNTIKNTMTSQSIDKYLGNIKSVNDSVNIWKENLASSVKIISLFRKNVDYDPLKSPSLFLNVESDKIVTIKEKQHWITIPIDSVGNLFEFELDVTDENNSFLIVFNYRVVQENSGLKWSGIRVLNSNGEQVKFVYTDGGLLSSDDYGSSSSTILTGLVPAKYNVQIQDYSGARTKRKFYYSRNLTVFRMQ